MILVKALVLRRQTELIYFLLLKITSIPNTQNTILLLKRLRFTIYMLFAIFG